MSTKKTSTASVYDFKTVEKAAQQFWSQQQSFEVKEDLCKEKFYCLSMLPYPSGQLHMGHVRNYTIGDVIARYQHMQGKNVLQPMGWDAFGLPAENAAIKHKKSPAIWSYDNIQLMRKQLKQLGLALDWKREITTCKPEFYRWEQWLFVQLYKKGLVYRKNAIVNWDPVDQTVLANEQVIDGKGWRSGAPVERREIPQWFLKITAYAEELLGGLDKLDGWPEQVKTMQRNWIGRSQGLQVNFKVTKSKQIISVFTTRPDTLMGVSYLAIAPEHPLAKEVSTNNKEIAKFIEQCSHIKASEAELATIEKLGVDSGLTVTHPISKQKLPIWIANFVLMEYGSGAVMAVPAHDQRDFEFAQKYKLPIKQVIAPNKKRKWDFTKEAYSKKSGKLINSGEFDGLTSAKAIKAISDYITEHNYGEPQIHYRLRDWGVSRQRYWGTPIPIIYCKHCGDVPVPEDQLPVLLPEGLVPTGSGSPLAQDKAFMKAKCPNCGKAGKRETDTFDTFVESAWYYARYCSYDQDTAMLDDRADYWTPVDQYIGGIEHGVMHLLYARFMHKVIRDVGLLNSDEPFTRLLTQGMVLKDGHKMSKSKGNVVSPNAMIKKFGADTVRLFSIFAAPPDQSLEWSDSSIEGCYRYLKRLHSFADKLIPVFNQQATSELDISQLNNGQINIRKQLHSLLKQANLDMQRLQYNTVASAAMKILNLLQPLDMEKDALLLHEGMKILLPVLSPICPHVTHALWQQLGFGDDILAAGWPKVDNKALRTDQVTLVVQVNGKLRAKIDVPADADQRAIQKLVLANPRIQRHVADKAPKKVIVVPNRLVNIVI